MQCSPMQLRGTNFGVPKKGEFLLPGYFCCRCKPPKAFFYTAGPGTGPLYSLTENPCRTLIFVYICSPQALVAELVDAHDSKSCAFGRGGSIPSWGTNGEFLFFKGEFPVFFLSKTRAAAAIEKIIVLTLVVR